MTKKANSPLEQSLFDTIEEKTPDYIKKRNLLDMKNNKEFEFVIKKEYLYPYDENTNKEGMGLWDWFAGYEKEARVSTAGIRGPQNILYPEDTRFPINKIGILLATLGKALVANEKYPSCDIRKLAACEVRYNSKEYLSLIARIQAALNIKTYIPVDYSTIPIWMASFLVFKLDLLGGEYITSSHGISVKNATKDLNDQGSQFLPEESIAFVNKIREVFEKVEQDGSYTVKLAAADTPLIDEQMMEGFNNGVNLYVDYLRHGVGNDYNLDLIKKIKNNIIIENVGGSAYNTLSKILEKLKISAHFDWQNTKEDPFFHGIGKSDIDPNGNKAFYDWSVDATVMKKKNGKNTMPVIESLHYEQKLSEKPVGTVVLITDPDHDRLSVAQINSTSDIDALQKLGLDYVPLADGKILTVYTANQSFLMLMDFWTQSLKKSGKFDKHPRFIIKTTASAMSWDEWANKNNIKVVNVPVGFKEIANIMKKVELQIRKNPNANVVVEDVFGNEINLGIEPRLVFAGEESGGMIMGSDNLIKSNSGRIAIAMREKSAAEAIIVASALCSECEAQNIMLFEYLASVFEKNQIKGRYDVREDISYYNESESDIDKLKASKIAGEALRTKNDLFFLSMVMAKREGLITLDNIKEILLEAFPELSFNNLKDALYVGDGSYFKFDDKYIEIRPSGTDAKTKAYGAGLDKEELVKYASLMGNYSGDRTPKFFKYIPNDYYETVKDHSLDVYSRWAIKDAEFEPFCIPKYDF